LRNIINKNSVTINDFFVLRTHAWFKLVLMEAVGIDNYWYRFEFAKSRGAIHFHALVYSQLKSQQLHTLLNRLLILTNMEAIEETESVIAQEVSGFLSSQLVPITALHPAGRDRSSPDIPCETIWYKECSKVANGAQQDACVIKHYRIGTDVSPDKVGNVYAWTSHEGTAPKATSSSLTTPLYLVQPQDRMSDLCNHCNRVGCHCCSAYCLTKRVPRANTGQESNVPGVPIGYDLACRTGFGVENKAVTARSDGKPARSSVAFTVRNGLTQFESERDNPRLVQGNFEINRGYGANYDFQVVLSTFDDVPDIDWNQLLDWAAAYINDFNTKAEEIKVGLKRIYSQRKHMNKSSYTTALGNYVTVWLCMQRKTFTP
jgi:hypothetical protein